VGVESAALWLVVVAVRSHVPGPERGSGRLIESRASSWMRLFLDHWHHRLHWAVTGAIVLQNLETVYIDASGRILLMST
jgi:hypothetical protein